MNQVFIFLYDYPALVIPVIAISMGIVCMVLPSLLIAESAEMTAGAISSLQRVSRLEGFGAGTVAGFGFSTATYLPFFKKKADAYDKLMYDLAQAQIAERTGG